MPALVAGIHALDNGKKEDVDGRESLVKTRFAPVPVHDKWRETS
jgi:hypothetical protein